MLGPAPSIRTAVGRSAGASRQMDTMSLGGARELVDSRMASAAIKSAQPPTRWIPNLGRLRSTAALRQPIYCNTEVRRLTAAIPLHPAEEALVHALLLISAVLADLSMGMVTT